MKTKREKVFETNSSSTHSLIYTKYNDSYLPASDKVIINFVDTNDDECYSTLREKVSYLVGQLINKYKWDCLNYEDLVEQVSNNYEFQELSSYVQEHFNKTIVFPEKYNGDLDEIVEINHQIVCDSIYDTMKELVKERD